MKSILITLLLLVLFTGCSGKGKLKTKKSLVLSYAAFSHYLTDFSVNLDQVVLISRGHRTAYNINRPLFFSQTENHFLDVLPLNHFDFDRIELVVTATFDQNVFFNETLNNLMPVYDRAAFQRGIIDSETKTYRISLDLSRYRFNVSADMAFLQLQLMADESFHLISLTEGDSTEPFLLFSPKVEAFPVIESVLIGRLQALTAETAKVDFGSHSHNFAVNSWFLNGDLLEKNQIEAQQDQLIDQYARVNIRFDEDQAVLVDVDIVTLARVNAQLTSVANKLNLTGMLSSPKGDSRFINQPFLNDELQSLSASEHDELQLWDVASYLPAMQMAFYADDTESILATNKISILPTRLIGRIQSDSKRLIVKPLMVNGLDATVFSYSLIELKDASTPSDSVDLSGLISSLVALDGFLVKEETGIVYYVASATELQKKAQVNAENQLIRFDFFYPANQTYNENTLMLQGNELTFTADPSARFTSMLWPTQLTAAVDADYLSIQEDTLFIVDIDRGQLIEQYIFNHHIEFNHYIQTELTDAILTQIVALGQFVDNQFIVDSFRIKLQDTLEVDNLILKGALDTLSTPTLFSFITSSGWVQTFYNSANKIEVSRPIKATSSTSAKSNRSRIVNKSISSRPESLIKTNFSVFPSSGSNNIADAISASADSGYLRGSHPIENNTIKNVSLAPAAAQPVIKKINPFKKIDVSAEWIVANKDITEGTQDSRVIKINDKKFYVKLNNVDVLSHEELAQKLYVKAGVETVQYQLEKLTQVQKEQLNTARDYALLTPFVETFENNENNKERIINEFHKNPKVRDEYIRGVAVDMLLGNMDAHSENVKYDKESRNLKKLDFGWSLGYLAEGSQDRGQLLSIAANSDKGFNEVFRPDLFEKFRDKGGNISNWRTGSDAEQQIPFNRMEKAVVDYLNHINIDDFSSTIDKSLISPSEKEQLKQTLKHRKTSITLMYQPGKVEDADLKAFLRARYNSENLNDFLEDPVTKKHFDSDRRNKVLKTFSSVKPTNFSESDNVLERLQKKVGAWDYNSLLLKQGQLTKVDQGILTENRVKILKDSNVNLNYVSQSWLDEATIGQLSDEAKRRVKEYRESPKPKDKYSISNALETLKNRSNIKKIKSTHVNQTGSNSEQYFVLSDKPPWQVAKSGLKVKEALEGGIRSQIYSWDGGLPIASLSHAIGFKKLPDRLFTGFEKKHYVYTVNVSGSTFELKDLIDTTPDPFRAMGNTDKHQIYTKFKQQAVVLDVKNNINPDQVEAYTTLEKFKKMQLNTNSNAPKRVKSR